MAIYETLFRAAIAEIFRETFEGKAEGASGTWFVEGREAILDTCHSITALEASSRANGQTATIGAHVFHACYYLTLFNAAVRGEEEQNVDWEGSWKHQSFDEAAWNDLVSDLESQYKEAMATYMGGGEVSSEEDASHAVGNLAHAAYHLGAIRSLLPIVRAL